VKVVTMGMHVLDVLVRPVEEIPEGQGTALVEDIRMTAAGTAGGTALTLAKLGASVRSAGAVGDDPQGALLAQLLTKAGVDPRGLVRRSDVGTSTSVLPVRPNGDRPSLHLLGANVTYSVADVDWADLEWADHLHLGAPELIGAEVAAEVLRGAKERGCTTSVDLVAPGVLGSMEAIGAALPYVDLLLPNDDQVTGFSGRPTVAEGARAFLDAGVGVVAATCGADGALVVTRDEQTPVPAFEVAVVDTTGCGDAFSAGFVVGTALGRSPVDAAVLGSACAALVAQGLGSDHGTFDLAAADAFAASAVRRTG
jgi:sugar/nucleoside kinase (ribokinase family)